MNTTDFYDIHGSLGAKIVSYAGFSMPIQYKGGIKHEHMVVRNNVGIFDVTHMGEFKVVGPQAFELVQKLTINDASKLQKWDAQYTAMCNEEGGIIDDLLLYHMGNDGFLMVVNGANIDKDFAWVQKQAEGMDVEVMNQSDEIHLLAVQGPKSLDVLNPITEVDMSVIPFYKFREGLLCGEHTLISRTGYTGELGFELYFRNDKETAEMIWNEIMKAGQEHGIEAVGLGARDTLRLEKGYALYGNDIDETTNPIEAGLGWITKLGQNDDFIGKDALIKIKENPIERKLVGFVVDTEKFIARQGYKVFSGEEEIGYVTSGNFSPSLNVAIGMAYVKLDYKAPGTAIEIDRKGKRFPATVKRMPLI